MAGLDRLVLTALESRIVSECLNALRNFIVRGVVKAVYDSGAQKTVDLVAHAGQERSKVPVHEPFGFTSHPPVNGAITHIIQNGADASDLIALQLSNPTVARFGNLKEGETVLYDSVGQRLHFQNGKLCRVDVCENFQVGFGANKTVLNVHETGIDITGNLTVSETIKSKGSISTEDALNVRRDIVSQGDIKSREVSLQNHDHTTTDKGAPTSPPVTQGGKTPDPEPPDSGGGKEPELDPKDGAPWLDKDGNIIGEQGGRKRDFLLPPSENPNETIENMAEDYVKYQKRRGRGVVSEEIKGHVKDVPISNRSFSDGSQMTTRGPGGATNTPNDWATIEISRSKELTETTGLPSIKFKARPTQ